MFVPPASDRTGAKMQSELCGVRIGLVQITKLLGIVKGNPGVFQGDPYPYPCKPVPAPRGTGFGGLG